MVTPLDAVCLQMIQASRRVDEAHYYLADPPRPHPRQMIEEANFHLIERNISMNQIGFDYYSNIVTYRV